MIDVQQRIACLYCGGEAVLYEMNAHHPYAPGLQQNNIYRCKTCSSLLTFPVPDAQTLNALYSSFDKGMEKKARELRTLYPLRGWFRQCLAHMINGTTLKDRDFFSWIDVGAGEGEMSNLLQTEFPGYQGTAVDFHERPESLIPAVAWIRSDLNGEKPANLKPADLVFAITVFEHMADPVHFIRSCLALLKPGGVFYFNCPRVDCNAFRILGRRWPYYLPGEHITVPSISGLEQLMHRECREKFGENYSLSVEPVIMPYPLGFYMGYIFPFAKKIFPSKPDVYFPTGILECKLILSDADR